MNLKGIIIENEMLDWLLPEYDIYCIYQKYPGNLYEYPYLRFAQWIMQALNKTILLYLHTKGAFNSHPFQFTIRKLWMNEFKSPRNKIYIQPILKNISDITTPFRKGACTWYNGMFISKRAFDLIPMVSIEKRRHFYEGGIFAVNNIRIKGIIKNRISPKELGNAITNHLKYPKNENRIIQDSLLLGFIIIIKLFLNNPLKFLNTKK